MAHSDWKSGLAVEASLRASGTFDSFAVAAWFASFLRGAVFLKDFRPRSSWNKIIKPTSAGRELVSSGLDSAVEWLSPEQSLALFYLLYHHEPLVDVEGIDSEACRKALEKELMSASLILPSLHGRRLYDKFNDEFLDPPAAYLDASATERLLEGSPIGVHQVGLLVSGPLGLLVSDELRAASPRLDRLLPLWHCPDTGCERLHWVRLTNTSCPFLETLNQLSEAADELWGPRSDWEAEILGRSMFDPAREIPYSDMLDFLGNCVLGDDSRRLLAIALKSPAKERLREAIGQTRHRTQASKQNAEQLSSSLTQDERIQLLAVLRNSQIAELIDAAIDQRQIDVEPEEVRKAPRLRWLTSHTMRRTELSALGIRWESIQSPVRLQNLVVRFYEANDHAQELDWRIRRRAEQESRFAAIARYLHETGPKDVMKSLLTNDRRMYESLCDYLQIAPDGRLARDDRFEDKLLWKLGFSPRRYSGRLKLLHQRIDAFEASLQASESLDDEVEREPVRSAGANLFVSIEDFLDGLVSFNTWLCACDHFGRTKFKYDRASARLAVVEQFGKSILRGRQAVTFSATGENTIGTLLTYSQELVKWLEGRLGMDRAHLERGRDELPHRMRHEDEVFPFLHREAWADFSERELVAYLSDLRTLTGLLSESEVASVRNGLDHKRGSGRFPAKTKMLDCAFKLRHAVGLADRKRFVPKRYWVDRYVGGGFGMGTVELKDYAGQPLRILTPIPAYGFPGFPLESPVIVAPGDLLSEFGSPLYFLPGGGSIYSSYWRGYPRRRGAEIGVAGETGA